MIGSLSANAATVYLPEFFHPQSNRLENLLSWQEGFPGSTILDLFEIQKKELFKINNPRKSLSKGDIDRLYNDFCADREILLEGLWVYYPWLNKILHILNKDEFISLRTNRNFYKITPQEQATLSTKSIGIVGLSVGHAVALTLATERVCGKMRLADFDSLELSNLNRIKTGLFNLGINKAILTAREIAEIDPFIEVSCFTEGISEDNIDEFLSGEGNLDILVDECDSIDIKILCRQKAKAYGIPVVMETSDRGMLDVERFDIEKDRHILHGLMEGVPLKNLSNLTTEQKIPLVLKVADFKKGSLRGKISMLEVGQSINTWPQLASSVALGGAVIADVCRRILLDQYRASGRFYIDLEQLTDPGNLSHSAVKPATNPFLPFDPYQAFQQLTGKRIALHQPEPDVIEEIVSSACQAPSTGNDQPWKWIYNKGILYLFHDRHRAYSFGNYDDIASFISFGAAFENLRLKSTQLGLAIEMHDNFERQPSDLVAAFEFKPFATTESIASEPEPALVHHVYTRCTNRNPSEPTPIPEDELEILRNTVRQVENAELLFFTEKKHLLEIGKIIGECDRIRLLSPQGHYDFANREMRWSEDEAIKSRDGIDIRTLGLSGPLQAALSIIRDSEIVAGLKNIGGGNALVDAATATVMTSSAIGIIILPGYTLKSFFDGGIAAQRVWLKSESLGYAIHPLISPFYLFPRVVHGQGDGLDSMEIDKLNELRKRFLNIVPISKNNAEVFLFKIAKAPKPTINSLRLPLEQCFWVINE